MPYLPKRINTEGLSRSELITLAETEVAKVAWDFTGEQLLAGMEKWARQALGIRLQGGAGEFRDLVTPDGSFSALKAALRHLEVVQLNEGRLRAQMSDAVRFAQEDDRTVIILRNELPQLGRNVSRKDRDRWFLRRRMLVDTLRELDRFERNLDRVENSRELKLAMEHSKPRAPKRRRSKAA